MLGGQQSRAAAARRLAPAPASSPASPSSPSGRPAARQRRGPAAARSFARGAGAAPAPDELPDRGAPGDPAFYLSNRETKDAGPARPAPPPLVRVRLNVHYRVHSRQMLCIGGSQIPFGWSFLSISKVPMTWNQGDVWTCEVRGRWMGRAPRARCAPAPPMRCPQAPARTR
jgi:hypothetical protein